MVKEELNFFSLGLSLESGGRGKKCGGAWGGIKNPSCEAATICGGRPGLLSLANDADRGEPTNE
jgi:hypothetical protein